MKILLIIIILFSSFVLSGCNNTNTSNNSGNFSNNNYTIRKKQEIELSSFSTPLTSSDENHLTNIKITSDKINELILENGETFSFNEIIGPCTEEEGYKKAQVFVNKQIEYALGGRKLSS